MAKSQQIADFHFPEDTLFEIFTYLPTKSVGKFRLLSKTWNTQLSTSQFIKLHQTRKPYQQNLLLLTQRHPIHLATHPVVFSKEITQLGTPWLNVAGSCNGLVLLISLIDCFDYGMVVINPITRQRLRIPDHPSVKPKGHASIKYSFGYDSSCDDYKVVLFYLGAYVHVFSLKTRVWNSFDYEFGSDIHSAKVITFVNGAVHWFIEGYFDIYGICAFDLATGSFKGFNLPKGLDENDGFDGLVVLRGCLAIIHCFKHGSTDVWVMNEYGMRDSWVRLRINVDVSLGRNILPLCFVGDEEVLCSADGRSWFVYDLKGGTRKEMAGGEMPVSFSDWVVFEESLIAPDGS